MISIISKIFIGLVAVITFLIITNLLGWLGKKIGFVPNNNDENNDMEVGCALWFIIIILAFACFLIGGLITYAYKS